jgi:hypothetical protein
MPENYNEFDHVVVDEGELELAREIIEIDLTLAGLRGCVMTLNEKGIVHNLHFCEPGKTEELWSIVSENRSPLPEHQGQQFVFGDDEILQVTKSNLLKQIGHDIILE